MACAHRESCPGHNRIGARAPVTLVTGKPRRRRQGAITTREDSGMIGKMLVGVAGFEPATPSSRTRCATRLRYTPIFGRGAYIAFRPPRPQAQGALIARALVGIVRTRSRIADGA